MPLVKLNKHVPSGTIILNREDKRNALSRDLLRSIRQALEDFHQERRVAQSMTGAGSAFCAGMDLDEMYQTNQQENPFAQWHEDAVQYRELVEYMLRFPKPIIAALNGPAVAGGAGLVLASDLVIACKSARFGLPEPRRGIVAGIVAPLLSFRVGGSHAARLLLTAQLIEADEAQRIGVYHEVVEEDVIWARAHETAEEIAKSAPEAIQLSKKLLNETIGEHLSTMLAAGAADSATARTTEAAAEGLSAFREKREPVWP